MNEEAEVFMVYKDNGPFQRKGGTYDIVTCSDKQERDIALKNGHHAHPDDIGKPAAKPVDSKSGK